MPRFAATSALHSVDSINRNRARLQCATPVPINRARSNSLDDPLTRGQRQAEASKIRMGMQIDDIAFRNQLLETQVLATKEHTRWNFEVLIDLFEGPLVNPKRLDEAIKGTKFMRRIMGFLQPLEHRYADMKNNEVRLLRRGVIAR